MLYWVKKRGLMKQKKKRAHSLKRKVVPKKSFRSKKHAVLAHKRQHAEATVHVYKKEFGKAPEEKFFHLHDGRKLQTLFELVDELETLGDEAFREYVNWERNDFANWINDVFELPTLAEELRHVDSRHDTQRTILKHFARELKKLVTH